MLSHCPFLLGKNNDNQDESDDDKRKKEPYPEIFGHLYIFDLIDTICLLGFSCKDKHVRRLSLLICHEAGKLKRLIAGYDKRKSLSELIN